MNAMSVMGATQTMSSREIAELTGKRHDHVMRDVRDMLAQLHGEGGLPRFGDTYRNEQNGQEYPIFNLPKRETLILVSGYNLTMRAKIIDRWQELEAEQQRPDPMAVLNDPAAMRSLLLGYSEKVIALETANAALAPKAAFAEQVEAAPDAISVSRAAKLLGTGRNRLAQKLRELRWCTRTGEPYQDKIQAGLLDVKISRWDHPNNGLQSRFTTLITGKGLARLNEVLAGWLEVQRQRPQWEHNANPAKPNGSQSGLGRGAI